ncbi:MAG: SDR family oxidoreductase [Deltaproteobacteria bacterium]|nr:SDR family oxidoreductase [Deltaproteobacteria bacterium]MBW2052661.1 SDR family oxidoreductase [Deltaproteobacteria bacterium]MBW2141580.1 SDR family oxidoreductase [Deltaproteobacteria bacterium]MBW2323159.1 SDR family oxidoreductase [Deltaproteobacteria bacterium]
MSQDINSMFSLEGKTALVAGASRGIGEEIARIFSLAGAKLVVSSRRPEGIQESAERIKSATGGEVLAVASNISSADDRKKLVDETLKWAGRIDILVNNAGTNPAWGPLEDVAESAWDKIFEVNLKGPFLLSQLVFHGWMKDHGGSILNTASVGGFSTSTGTNVYNVTKAALIHLTKAMASEWGKNGIRVNALAPGLIKTKLSQALWDRPGSDEAAASWPVSRLGIVEDLAGISLLLVSEAGSFITGQTHIVDGGSIVSR